MIELARQGAGSVARIGSQPIALAAATLLIILAGVVAIGLARAYSGLSPETDRTLAARQLQARAADASEQLLQKTNALAVTQQESIDQLQMVQDQLQQIKKMLAAQQTDSKRLSDQVSALTEAIEGLRQSFAGAQASEAAGPPPSRRNRALRIRAHATMQKKPAKSRG
ncbi:MAG: hypothetical protein JO283_12805 [Bradyrhizobium sp.]|nr:hypothetical protein [Bradyrhizobium sp.]